MSGTVPPTVTPLPSTRLHALFAGLDRSGARWSLLRPATALTQSAGDIDLLVDPVSLRDVRRVVQEQAFVVMPLGGRDIHAADYDHAEDRFLWLHIQPELRLGGKTVAAQTVLDTVLRDPLPRPDDAWLLWILLLHGLLDKGVISARHRHEVMRLAQAGGPAPSPLVQVAKGCGLSPDLVLELAAAGDWEGLGRLPITGAAVAPTHGERLTGTLDRVRRLWTRRGVAVAVIGPDGAGKTTLVNGLEAALPFPTRILYMGLTGGRLPRADALRVPGLVLGARLAILWVRWGVGLYERARGRVILFDRYVLDGLVPSGAPCSPFGRASRRLQAVACPRPDLVLLLDASGTTMYSRKGEYDSQRLEEWRAAYHRLSGRVAGLEVLDAEQPADAVRRDAVARIWRCYVERWHPDGAARM